MRVCQSFRALPGLQPPTSIGSAGTRWSMGCRGAQGFSWELQGTESVPFSKAPLICGALHGVVNPQDCVASFVCMVGSFCLICLAFVRSTRVLEELEANPRSE